MIFSISISIISLIFSIVFSRLQIKHNKYSVKPIASIIIGDYEDDIYIKLRNDGNGPLTITKSIFSTNENTANSLIELFFLDITWTTFIEELNGRSISPNNELVLLQKNSKT